MDKCRRWGQKVSWCRATAWLTLHPQLTHSNGKSQHMPPHVLCLKRGKSCSLLLWVIYPGIANLWISNWEGHVCFETFPLAGPTPQNLQTWRTNKGDGLWEVSEKRLITINQFMFKGVINDKLKLAWTEQVLSFPWQMNFNVFCTNTVWNYTEPNLHRKEACFVLHRMTMNGNIQGTALYQLICGWLVNALLFQVRERVNIFWQICQKTSLSVSWGALKPFTSDLKDIIAVSVA